MKAPEIKKFKLSQLVAAEYNPREIDESALEGLANSISRFGCVEPIVVNVRAGPIRSSLERLGAKDEQATIQSRD